MNHNSCILSFLFFFFLSLLYILSSFLPFYTRSWDLKSIFVSHGVLHWVLESLDWDWNGSWQGVFFFRLCIFI